MPLLAVGSAEEKPTVEPPMARRRLMIEGSGASTTATRSVNRSRNQNYIRFVVK